MKQTIRLTESELRSMIKSTISEALNEIGDTPKGQYMIGRAKARAKSRGDNNTYSKLDGYGNKRNGYPTDINAQGYQDQSQQMYYNDDNNYPASGINNKEKWKGEQNYYKVHGAFRCMKAQDKRNIEQNENLSDIQKEAEKQAVDRFYDEFDMRLTEELNRRCVVRIERR